MRSDGRAILWLLAGLAAILVAAGLSWFHDNFEPRVREIETGYSAAARRNPFLAAERFLARLGMRVESVSGRELLRDLPPVSDTLVANSLGVLNRERHEALHRWIERGGRLIVEAANLEDETEASAGRRDQFLDRYAVRLREPENAQEPDGSVEEVLATVRVEDYPHRLEVESAARYFLEDIDEQASGGVVAEDRARLLQYEIGDGLLTVTSDTGFLANRQIGRQDNALFLALLAVPREGGKIWLLYDSRMPWLGALLWQQAPFAIVSTLALLVLIIWHLGARLGPFSASPAGDRRDLMAHLQASADFLWSHGQGGRLTQLSGQCIEQAWLRRHSVLRELERSGRVAWIAGHQGLSSDDVGRVLYPTAVNEGDLIPDTALLQRLWSSLSAPGDVLSARKQN